MAETIETNSGYNSAKHKGIQLTAASTASDETILAELAEYDAIHNSAIGSKAMTANLAVICNKANDGTWVIIR